MGNNNQKNDKKKDNLKSNKKSDFNIKNNRNFSSVLKSKINIENSNKQNKRISTSDIYENELYELSPVKKRLNTNDNFKSFFEQNLKETKKIDTKFLRKSSFLTGFGETLIKIFKKKKQNETKISESKKKNTSISQRTNISECSSNSLLKPIKITVSHQFLLLNFKNPINEEKELNHKKKFSSNSDIKTKIYILPNYNPPIYLKPQIEKEELPIYISKHIESNYKKKKHNEKIYGLFIKKIKNFKFIGTKKNNEKEDFGLIIWNDKSILKGKFKNNKINNISSFSNSKNNTLFKGYYKNNKPLGFGIYHSKNEDLLCQGDWINDKLNGIGIQLWNHSNFFYGEFKENKKEGIGTVRFEDGTKYYGEFKNNKIDGYGIINYANGNYYEGEFNDGIINGYGEFTWINGKKYIGFYKFGEKNGFGIYVNNTINLDVIVGFWNNGKLNGPCIIFKKSKIEYFLYRDGLKCMKFQAGIFCLKFLNEKYKKFWKLFDIHSNKLKVYIRKIINREIEIINHNKLF